MLDSYPGGKFEFIVSYMLLFFLSSVMLSLCQQRSSWYNCMTALEDEEVQKKG